MKKCLGLSLVLIASAASAQLSGTYTINGSTTTSGINYQTFSDAFSALTTQGVSGPVTFNCVEGTYTEQVYLSSASITGTSTTNTVTFQADASNTKEVLWQHSRQALYMHQCTLNNITFDGLTFATTGLTSSTIFSYLGTQTNMKYTNCIMIGTLRKSPYWVFSTFISYATTLVNLEVSDSEIKNGSFGFYLYSTNHGYNSKAEVTIENNTIDNFVSSAIFGGFQRSKTYTRVSIIENSGTNRPDVHPIPMVFNVSGPKEGSIFSKNHFELNGDGGYGMIIDSAQGTSSKPVMVTNNVINFPDSNDRYSQQGLTVSRSKYTKILHNTVVTTSTHIGSSVTSLMFGSSTNVGNEFKNNIMQGGGGGAYSFTLMCDFGSIKELVMNNNVYVDRRGGTQVRMLKTGIGGKYTLGAWQSATSQDANSSDNDPLFTTSTYLVPTSANVDNSGAALGIIDDIDGKTRNTSNPDPGAYEFIVPLNNAEPVSLLAPSNPLCGNDTNISVSIKNTGLVNLTSLHIKYIIDSGSAQTYKWTGKLAPKATDSVIVASKLAFNKNALLKLWTELPNGVKDSSAVNDTIKVSLFTGLSGTYSIPNDYATLNDAADALAAAGVCDHVVFNIAPNVYSGQVSFAEIPGTSANATVTFQSATGDNSSVNITAKGGLTGTDAHTIQFAGADWVTFKNVTITSTGNFYATAVDFQNGSDNNTIAGCLLRTTKATGSHIVRMENCNTKNTTLLNNRMVGGGFRSIYCKAFNATPSNTSRIENLRIEGNTIDSAGRYSIDVSYSNHTKIIDNRINNTIDNSNPATPNSYGIYFGYSDYAKIQRNRIKGMTQSIYLNFCRGSLGDRVEVSNNCITTGAPYSTGGSAFPGLYMVSCDSVNVYHNSVNQLSNHPQYNSCLFVTFGSMININNNNLANYSNGPAMHINGLNVVAGSDNNNLFSTSSSSLINYNGTVYSNLQSYQKGVGYDLKSVNVDPKYSDTLNCATCNDTLDGAGTPTTGLLVDIDSIDRSTTAPDIGAVEFLATTKFSLGADTAICGNKFIIEVRDSAYVSWNVNNQNSSGSSVTLTALDKTETFNVEVDLITARCGSAFDKVTITLVPDASLDINDHICADSSTNLNPGGGGKANYIWSPNGETTPSITVDESGTYTVVKTEMGCKSSSSISITQSDSVTIDDVMACSDKLPVTLDASIKNGTSYSWSGGASVGTAINTFSKSGKYNVTATDVHGCSSFSEFSLAVLEKPQAKISKTHTDLIYKFDASSSLHIDSNTTYFWDFGYNNLTSINISDSVTYPWSNPNNPTTYAVTLAINNGCGTDVDTMQITPVPSLGIEDIAEGAFALYPNPATGQVNFALTSVAKNRGEIQVHDLAGRIVLSQSFETGITNGEINVSELVPGSYMVKAQVDNISFISILIKE